MKTYVPKIILPGLGLLLAAAPGVRAQNADHRTALSGYATTLQYRGDLGSNFWNTRNLPFGGGLTLSRYLSKGFNIGLSANYNKLRFPAAQGTYTGARRFDAKLYSAGLNLKLKLPIKDDFFVHPYILLQPGFSWVVTDRSTSGVAFSESRTKFGAFDGQAGLGLDFRLGPGAGFFVQAGQHYLYTDDARLDGVGGGSNSFWDKHDRYMQFSAGLTANMGKAKDEDQDGVADRKDKCPGTPPGVKVDPTGCPLDGDGDGVADYQDKCPGVKGVAALQGCPDKDGDGIADADDQCPDVAGTAALRGCPDADGDGVTDQADKCPGTPSGVKVDATGCPLDGDGDGVPDAQDRCPDRAGPASNKGCPEIKAEQKKVLNEATKYINFDFNKATLKSSSFPKLQQMVAILNEYPDYSLSIAGHTDNKGNDAYNLKLSYDRAAAARTYMLSKGVPAARIEARGYGETKPLADNAAAAGQAQNRRVDFNAYLTGEANAAEVKYGPAPTVAELLKQGKAAPTPAKAGARKKAPAPRKASRPAPRKRR